jgi:hypothetical protein
MKRAPLAAIGLGMLLLAACGSSATPPSRATTPPVPQLRSMEQLRAAFNARETMPRLVVLISPT